VEPYPAIYKSELQQLLKVADDRGPQAVGNAAKRYQSARNLHDDGSADYAYGLVLLRLNKPKEALTTLARGADVTPAPYLPALRAYVALALQQKQWPGAMERMEKLGRAFAAHPEWWPTPDALSADAQWLGRATALGEVVVTSAADVERFTKLDQSVRSVLPAELRTAYSSGYDAVLTQAEQLADSAAKEESTARVTQEHENEVARDKVKTQQTQAEAERENLKLTSEEWKKFLDDKLAEFSKQLGTLEKQVNQLDQRRQSLERSILLAQQEQQLLIARGQSISSVQSQTSRNTGTNFSANANAQAIQAINQQLDRLQIRINQYQQEHTQVQNQIALGLQQSMQTLNQRQALITNYEQATGKLVQQDESLRKMKDRLSQKEKDLAESPKGKAASVQSLEQKRKSPATYLPMDWEAERQRWLQDLAS
jgi:hypothetical protein